MEGVDPNIWRHPYGLLPTFDLEIITSFLQIDIAI